VLRLLLETLAESGLEATREEPESIPPVLSVRPSGFEPLTYGSGASNTLLGDSSKRSQGVGSARVGARGRVQPLHGIAPLSSPFAAPVLQGSDTHSTGPRAVERLLRVGEVAERLRVSTATVYALCKRGELAHARVANSIRVSERALAAFCSRA
jgi:excisionase family DNA binding protein